MINKIPFNKITIIFLFILSIFETGKSQIPTSAKSNAIVTKQSRLLEPILNIKELRMGNPVFIRIFKETLELELWIKKSNSKTFGLFKTYKICTYGSRELGPKLKEGDGMAPEGFYFVDAEKLNPNSKYHLAFNIGYPNQFDKEQNRTGSAIMVHGACVSIGCYAMTNDGIEEIYTLAYKALAKGQKYISVHCFPFRMNNKNLERFKNSKWYPFWKNLKDGYQFFEDYDYPPNTTVKNKKYIFSTE